MKNRNAFTMIELIFVIVILGILSAIVIPKLSATRDDAQLVAYIKDIRMAINDISNYYNANASFSTIKNMTNVIEFNNTQVDLKNGGAIFFQTRSGGSLENCIKFDFNVSGIVTIENTGTYSGDLCRKLQANPLFLALDRKHILGGSHVKH